MSREPLTPQEQSFAQRLQAWPAGEPPPQLDERILAAARAAAKPRARKRRPALVGVASAAALVLTVGLAWRVSQEPARDDLMRAPASVPEMRAAEPLRDESIDTGAAAPKPAGVVSPEPQESPPQPVSAEAERDGQGGRTAAPVQQTIAPAPADADVDEAPDGEARRQAPLQAPAARRDAPPVPATPAPPAGAPSRPRAFAPSPPQEPEPQAQSEHAAPAGEAAPPPPREQADDLRRLRLEAPAASTAGQAKAEDAFAAAVAQIRDLLDRGDIDAARAAIARLRERFPRREIPVDLLGAERGDAQR